MAENTEISLPVAEATINPLPKLGIHRPVRKDLGNKLTSFHLFKQLPQELQDEIWTAAVQTPTVLAPERVTEDGLVRWDKQAIWSFSGMDPHTISQVCKDAREIVKKYCITFRGKITTPITTKSPVVYANIDTTMFVLGDIAVEGHSFYESDIAKMKYVTIEGRNAGFCWVPDPYNLQPGPASGALAILATLARDLKAVFVHHKLSISASEDPVRVARDLDMFVTPDPASFADGVRPLNADLFAYLSNFVGYNGPEINDERRCTYVQHKERELVKLLFVAEDSFANGSPAIHFLPLYSPYREYFADANQERGIDHAACHHELKPRDEVTDDEGNKICRPPPTMTETQAMLNSRQEEMEDYEAAMLAAWPDEWM
uniref:2EXR domain-containing protein n=1 Tax=Bionectria ochroleuca TaxID=29856 RepID=A0A8H7K722_BIOOC